ncbi:MAG: hypothetical protein K2R98_17200 [Gemmataceae bacterium]|nr:hypothetical protein [Gemmataceae bacterium]
MSVPLCRFAGHTCAACCWGDAVPRPVLEARLRRQTHVFRRWFRQRRPRRTTLFLYELAVRGAADLLVLIPLLLPMFNDWLRPWLKGRTVCAYLGSDDNGGVGCLLHPTRWDGEDVRERVAFALLPGFSCGRPDYFCVSAHWFARAGWEDRSDFARKVRKMGWYRFSQAAQAFRPHTMRKGADAAH